EPTRVSPAGPKREEISRSARSSSPTGSSISRAGTSAALAPPVEAPHPPAANAKARTSEAAANESQCGVRGAGRDAIGSTKRVTLGPPYEAQLQFCSREKPHSRRPFARLSSSRVDDGAWGRQKRALRPLSPGWTSGAPSSKDPPADG